MFLCKMSGHPHHGPDSRSENVSVTVEIRLEWGGVAVTASNVAEGSSILFLVGFVVSEYVDVHIFKKHSALQAM